MEERRLQSEPRPLGSVYPLRHRSLTVAAPIGVELGIITWIRQRYMDTPIWSAALQVGFGGALVFATGILIGSS